MINTFKGLKCFVFSRIEQDHLFKRTLRNSNPKVSTVEQGSEHTNKHGSEINFGEASSLSSKNSW